MKVMSQADENTVLFPKGGCHAAVTITRNIHPCTSKEMRSNVDLRRNPISCTFHNGNYGMNLSLEE